MMQPEQQHPVGSKKIGGFEIVTNDDRNNNSFATETKMLETLQLEPIQPQQLSQSGVVTSDEICTKATTKVPCAKITEDNNCQQQPRRGPHPSQISPITTGDSSASSAKRMSQQQQQLQQQPNKHVVLYLQSSSKFKVQQQQKLPDQRHQQQPSMVQGDHSQQTHGPTPMRMALSSPIILQNATRVEHGVGTKSNQMSESVPATSTTSKGRNKSSSDVTRSTSSNSNVDGTVLVNKKGPVPSTQKISLDPNSLYLQPAPSTPQKLVMPPLPATISLLDCDYDRSPTELYQLIEQNQWNQIMKRLEEEDDDDDIRSHSSSINNNIGNNRIRQQAAVWIVRKESSGRLRWRILPLHAAIIFRAPYNVIEAIIQIYPLAAGQKDDQGMLPLHLAMKNFSFTTMTTATSTVKYKKTTSSSVQLSNLDVTALWRIVEELITAYPAAIYSRDRKGRTPLQIGLQAVNSNPNEDDDEVLPQHQLTQATLSVVRLYDAIHTAGERNPSQQSKQLTTDLQQMATIHQNHLEALEQLRSTFWKQHTQQREEHVQKQKVLQLELDASLERERQLQLQLNSLKSQLQQQQHTTSNSSNSTGAMNTIRNMD
jgi:hypothetical protein